MSGVISGYTSLQASVGDWLARSDLTTFIPAFIQNWEERFYRDAKNWGAWMESALSVSISSNVAALPDDYLGLKIAYISGQVSPPLKRVSLEQLYQRYPRADSSLGNAAYIARNASNFEFGPYPDTSSATLVGTYYAKPVLIRSFASDAAAHFLILNAPDLCLYGALLEAEPFLKNDSRLTVWSQLYQVALDAYRSRENYEEDSGSPPATVCI